MVFAARAVSLVVFFFFQAEDGIRDVAVTGVQTCALPISKREQDARRTDAYEEVPRARVRVPALGDQPIRLRARGRSELVGLEAQVGVEIGRASCRERV